MMGLGARWKAGFFVGIVVLSLGTFFLIRGSGQVRKLLTKSNLARAFEDAGKVEEFPTEMDIPIDGQEKPVAAIVQYAFDEDLQESMEKLFKSYRPDYGAFVAIDAITGRVLSMVSYVHDRRDAVDNLALRATFPSASVFKVVTAAAAISERNFSANTVIPFDGRNHTLYRSNILRTRYSKWTRYMTMKEAFARSVNTVFGKIGAFSVGADGLRTYADRFGFNRRIAADVPIQEGHVAPIKDDPWTLAEVASGFTRENTMSPLQGALIAAAIVNDGVMMEPYVVQSVHKKEGGELYVAEPKVANFAVDAATARELRSMMRETVRHGTSAGVFRGFFKKQFANVDVGGKTGSLTGKDPFGKYDWFVGYAEGNQHRIAVAALTVHKKLWRVKSSYLARRAIERFLKDKLATTQLANVPAVPIKKEALAQ